MPHGDYSDYAASFAFFMGITALFRPSWAGVGIDQIGMKPFFDTVTPDMEVALSFTGGALIFIGLALYGVRWNTVNNIAAIIGCLFLSINSALIAHRMDGTFVFRGWHLFTVVYAIGALHFKFNANPVYTSAMLLEKEQEKAKKAK